MTRRGKYVGQFLSPLTQFVPLIQRYFVNDSLYEAGGPAFLMIGGEGTASPRWMVQGTVYVSGQ